MNRTTITVVLALSSALPGCEGQAASLATLLCDCYHCNDLTEEAITTYAEAAEDTADAYGCSDDWEKWADCVEAEAVCDEEKAELKTRSDGSCSVTVGTGLQACKGNETIICTSDDECPGEDRCGDQVETLDECIAAAAEDPSVGGVDWLGFD